MNAAKTKFLSTCLAVLATLGIFTFAACGAGEETEEEESDSSEGLDSEDSSSAESDTCEHSWVLFSSDIQSTGSSTFIFYCEKCSRTATLEYPYEGEQYEISSSSATCTEGGNLIIKTDDGSRSFEVYPALGHNYTAARYEYDEDTSSCQWYKYCSRAGCGDVSLLDETDSLSDFTILTDDEDNLSSVLSEIKIQSESHDFVYAIELEKDITIKSAVKIENCNIILDLNGHKISPSEDFSGSQLLDIASGASVRLNDTSSAQSGSLIYESTGDDTSSILVENGGKLAIYGGQIKGNSAVIIDEASELSLHGGTYDTFGNEDLATIKTCGKLTVYGGVIRNGSEDINHGIGIRIVSGSVIINGGEIISPNPISLYPSQASKSLTVNGGTIKGTNTAISNNGKDTGKAEIRINGGIIETENNENGEDTAVYLPSPYCTTYITGGEIKGSGAVEIRGGDLYITGGSITSVAEKFISSLNSSGSTTYGAAVAVAKHTTNAGIFVTISGGYLKGVYSLYEGDPSSSNIAKVASYSETSLSVLGGTLNGLVYSQSCTGFIHGGTFLNTYDDEEEGTERSYLNAETKIESEKFVTYYDTLKDAIEMCESGAVIMLISDADESSLEPITLDKDKNVVVVTNGYNITLAAGELTLNGTLTLQKEVLMDETEDEGEGDEGEGDSAGYADNIALTEENKDIVTINSSNEDNEDNENTGITIGSGGELTILEGVSILSGKDKTITSLIYVNGCLNVFGTIENKSSNANSRAIYVVNNGEANIFEGALIKGVNGIFIRGVSEEVEGSKGVSYLSVYGGEIIGTGIAITGNGLDEGYSAINIQGGTITCDGDTAIYLPSSGCVTTISGGSITGATGIEIRGGMLTIIGGEISSNAESFSANKNTSGSGVFGAALAINTYDASQITVTIEGGSFSGIYSLYEEYVNKSAEAYTLTYEIKISVSGGTFEGMLYSKNCASFITGGTYSCGNVRCSCDCTDCTECDECSECECTCDCVLCAKFQSYIASGYVSSSNEDGSITVGAAES